MNNRISLEDFIKTYIDTVVDVEPGWGYPGECVSLVQRYLHDCHGTVNKARGNAVDWRYSLINEGIAYKVDTPDYGDIVVWDKVANGYGHVAIIVGQDLVFEQNRFGVRSAKINDMMDNPIIYLRMKTALMPSEGEDEELREELEDLKRRVAILEGNKPIVNNIVVGGKVTLKTTAKTYQGASKGVTIPSNVKGKKYTIQQISGDSVLLKEIVSWVLKSDVE